LTDKRSALPRRAGPSSATQAPPRATHFRCEVCHDPVLKGQACVVNHLALRQAHALTLFGKEGDDDHGLPLPATRIAQLQRAWDRNDLAFISAQHFTIERAVVVP
jgi:hypothetical protein